MMTAVRIVKIISGIGLLVAGIVMLVIPGPGWLTIAAGLALLAEDFPLARRALNAIIAAVERLRRRFTKEV